MPIVDLKAEEGRIKQLLLDMNEAIHTHDIDAYMSYFHDDVIVLAPGRSIMKGIKSFREFMNAGLQYIVSIEYDEIYIKSSRDGSFAYCVGRYKAVEDLPKGRIVSIERLHWTLMNVDNVWKIIVFSWNIEKNL